jgi:hypothetical protein
VRRVTEEVAVERGVVGVGPGHPECKHEPR